MECWSHAPALAPSEEREKAQAWLAHSKDPLHDGSVAEARYARLTPNPSSCARIESERTVTRAGALCETSDCISRRGAENAEKQQPRINTNAHQFPWFHCVYDFAFRASDLFRISSFGFRICPLRVSIAAALPRAPRVPRGSIVFRISDLASPPFSLGVLGGPSGFCFTFLANSVQDSAGLGEKKRRPPTRCELWSNPSVCW